MSLSMCYGLAVAVANMTTTYLSTKQCVLPSNCWLVFQTLSQNFKIVNHLHSSILLEKVI